jgi:hypothetical protein
LLRDGFSDSGSFLDVGGHHFYIARPFLEEVTDVLDLLCDAGSSYSESSDLGVMIEVLALGDKEGGESPRTTRPPLEAIVKAGRSTPRVGHLRHYHRGHVRTI